jgi:hypothetical protein
VLSADQLFQLETTGWTRLEGAVPAKDMAAIRDRVWAFFAKRGVVRHDPATWPIGLSAKNQGLRQSGLFNLFANQITTALLDDLLGAGTWAESEAWGPALVTWPQPGPWQLPHKTWHFDLPGRGDPERPGAARLFGFVSDVVSHGGATLVVEGSHELVRRLIAKSSDHDAGQSSDLRHKLNLMHPWFGALTSAGGDRVGRFMFDGEEVDGVPVRVRELTGAPGDVVAMMPWTMHNFSMNCTSQPRFMVTHTVMRHDQRIYPTIPHSSKRGPAPIPAS